MGRTWSCESLTSRTVGLLIPRVHVASHGNINGPSGDAICRHIAGVMWTRVRAENFFCIVATASSRNGSSYRPPFRIAREYTDKETRARISACPALENLGSDSRVGGQEKESFPFDRSIER